MADVNVDYRELYKAKEKECFDVAFRREAVRRRWKDNRSDVFNLRREIGSNDDEDDDEDNFDLEVPKPIHDLPKQTPKKLRLKSKMKKHQKEKPRPFIVGIVRHKIHSPPFLHQSSFAPHNHVFRAPQGLEKIRPIQKTDVKQSPFILKNLFLKKSNDEKVPVFTNVTVRSNNRRALNNSPFKEIGNTKKKIDRQSCESVKKELVFTDVDDEPPKFGRYVSSPVKEKKHNYCQGDYNKENICPNSNNKRRSSINENSVLLKDRQNYGAQNYYVNEEKAINKYQTQILITNNLSQKSSDLSNENIREVHESPNRLKEYSRLESVSNPEDLNERFLEALLSSQTDNDNRTPFPKKIINTEYVQELNRKKLSKNELKNIADETAPSCLFNTFNINDTKVDDTSLLPPENDKKFKKLPSNFYDDVFLKSVSYYRDSLDTLPKQATVSEEKLDNGIFHYRNIDNETASLCLSDVAIADHPIINDISDSLRQTKNNEVTEKSSYVFSNESVLKNLIHNYEFLKSLPKQISVLEETKFNEMNVNDSSESAGLVNNSLDESDSLPLDELFAIKPLREYANQQNLTLDKCPTFTETEVMSSFENKQSSAPNDKIKSTENDMNAVVNSSETGNSSTHLSIDIDNMLDDTKIIETSSSSNYEQINLLFDCHLEENIKNNESDDKSLKKCRGKNISDVSSINKSPADNSKNSSTHLSIDIDNMLDDTKIIETSSSSNDEEINSLFDCHHEENIKKNESDNKSLKKCRGKNLPHVSSINKSPVDNLKNSSSYTVEVERIEDVESNQLRSEYRLVDANEATSSGQSTFGYSSYEKQTPEIAVDSETDSVTEKSSRVDINEKENLTTFNHFTQKELTSEQTVDSEKDLVTNNLNCVDVSNEECLEKAEDNTSLTLKPRKIVSPFKKEYTNTKSNLEYENTPIILKNVAAVRNIEIIELSDSPLPPKTINKFLSLNEATLNAREKIKVSPKAKDFPIIVINKIDSDQNEIIDVDLKRSINQKFSLEDQEKYDRMQCHEEKVVDLVSDEDEQDDYKIYLSRVLESHALSSFGSPKSRFSRTPLTKTKRNTVSCNNLIQPEISIPAIDEGSSLAKIVNVRDNIIATPLPNNKTSKTLQALTSSALVRPEISTPIITVDSSQAKVTILKSKNLIVTPSPKRRTPKVSQTLPSSDLVRPEISTPIKTIDSSPARVMSLRNKNVIVTPSPNKKTPKSSQTFLSDNLAQSEMNTPSLDSSPARVMSLRSKNVIVTPSPNKRTPKVSQTLPSSDLARPEISTPVKTVDSSPARVMSLRSKNVIVTPSPNKRTPKKLKKTPLTTKENSPPSGIVEHIISSPASALTPTRKIIVKKLIDTPRKSPKLRSQINEDGQSPMDKNISSPLRVLNLRTRNISVSPSPNKRTPRKKNLE